MTFLDMRHLITQTKMELHKDIDSLEAKVDKSNAALYKEIKEANRKLDMILEALSNLEKEKCDNPE